MTANATTLANSDAPMTKRVGGIAAAVATVLIWALWIVTTRQAAAVHIPAAWLGVIRFAVPAIALAPFWWRLTLVPKGVDIRLLALMVAGAGAPFFILVATGMHFASAAESGVLLGGTMPMFAAILSAMIDRERFGPVRLAGFALVLYGNGCDRRRRRAAGSGRRSLPGRRRRSFMGGLYARLPAQRARRACRPPASSPPGRRSCCCRSR